MKKLVICLALFSLFATAALAANPDDVVISQVYGGGGNSGGIYKNDFVELFNMTANPIDISGWTIQYGSAAGTLLGGTTSYQTEMPAGSIIQPCSWFLVAEAAGASTTQPLLPNPDVQGAIALSGSTCKVALVSNNTALGTSCTGPALIDIVAVGPTATCSETLPTAVMANSTAAIRITDASGYVDTNNNSVDFTIATPVPHNSGSGQLEACVGAVPVESKTWGAVKAEYK